MPKSDGLAVIHNGAHGGNHIAECEWHIAAFIEAMTSLSHDDLCRLSRSFNEKADLADSQDYRINEWLKTMIANSDR
jgi:hypothetical protein